MLEIGKLQQAGPSLTWVWYALLIILVLVVIFWLLNRPSGRPNQLQEEERPIQRSRTSADDLTKIEGIGPKVAGVLKASGITTFEALASADADHVKDVLNEAGLQMMKPEGWIEQAQLAARGDWNELERLQGELKGGRRK